MSVGKIRRWVGLVAPLAAVLTPGLAHAEPDSDPPLGDYPRGTYVWVPESAPPEADAPSPQAGGGQHVLFLNRCAGGLTITAGWPDDNVINRSGILGGTVNFPPFSYGDAAWQEVMEHSRQIFAPFNIKVTDIDPSPAPHDEAIVCGSGGQAGFGGAGGVAPFTCGVIDKSITFTFPDSLGGNPRVIAEVIAQEAAHAWGLEHEYKCEDPMSYLSGCGQKTYQDGDYPCGEYSPRGCECGGATQNSYQYILGLFGPAMPDNAQPSASIVYPADGDVFAEGDAFDIEVEVADDIGVSHVALYLDGALATEAIAEPWGPWRASDLPAGPHELYIEASDDAGNTTTSALVVVEITADGLPPAGGDDGGPSGGDNGGEDDAGDGAGDGGSMGDGMDTNALPPGLSAGYDEATVEGCSCRGGSDDPVSLGWLVLALWGFRWRRATR